MTKVMFILYVSDQLRSRVFYAAVLGREPALDLPGMTEFMLTDDSSLGLMPEAGVKRMLGDSLPDPASAKGVPRAELYLHVDNLAEAHARSLTNGGREIKPPTPMAWGDRVAYSLDPDGHVLALAETQEG